MTIKQIQKRQDAMNVKFDTAKKIRELLDAAKKTMGDEWDDSTEEEILDMVTGE